MQDITVVGEKQILLIDATDQMAEGGLTSSIYPKKMEIRINLDIHEEKNRRIK